MYLDKPTLRYRQQGFGLPLAIFIITVLALVIAAMSQLQQTSSEGVSLQVQSHRAFYAAESGIQLALNRLIPPDGSAGSACSASPFYQRDFSIPGLPNCSVTVNCSVITVTSINYYTLNATGTCGSGVDAAQRQIEVRVQ